MSFEFNLQEINCLTAEKMEGTAEDPRDYPAPSGYSLCPLQLRVDLQYFAVKQVVLGCILTQLTLIYIVS